MISPKALQSFLWDIAGCTKLSGEVIYHVLSDVIGLSVDGYEIPVHVDFDKSRFKVPGDGDIINVWGIMKDGDMFPVADLEITGHIDRPDYQEP